MNDNLFCFVVSRLPLCECEGVCVCVDVCECASGCVCFSRCLPGFTRLLVLGLLFLLIAFTVSFQFDDKIYV